MEVFLLHVDGDSNVGEEVMSRVSLSFTGAVSLSRQASPHFGIRPAISALFFHSLLAPSHMTHPLARRRAPEPPPPPPSPFLAAASPPYDRSPFDTW